jgi:hypothetical protein
MICPPITLSPVTPAQFIALQADAIKLGMDLSGETGQTTYDHCTVEWEYAEQAMTLTLQCTAKPFFVGCDTVNAALRANISKLLVPAEG